MSEKFNLDIISPDKTLISSEVNQVTIPAFEGMMTILKNHISLVTFLRPGIIKVETENGTENFFTEEGTVEFSNNTLLILSSTAKNLNFFSNDEKTKLLEDFNKQNQVENLTDKEKYILSYKIEVLKEINQ